MDFLLVDGIDSQHQQRDILGFLMMQLLLKHSVINNNNHGSECVAEGLFMLTVDT